MVTGQDERKDVVMSGIKFDGDKVKLHLLPFAALEEVGKVLTYGAAKYGEYNWRAGMGWSCLLGAAFRHLFAYMRGERTNHEPEIYDKVTGNLLHPATNYSHLAHAACDILMLLTYELNGEGTDDLYDVAKETTNEPHMAPPIPESCVRL